MVKYSIYYVLIKCMYTKNIKPFVILNSSALHNYALRASDFLQWWHILRILDSSTATKNWNFNFNMYINSQWTYTLYTIWILCVTIYINYRRVDNHDIYTVTVKSIELIVNYSKKQPYQTPKISEKSFFMIIIYF